MKFLQVGGSHPRNSEFMRRACNKYNIEYSEVGGPGFSDNKYDIIWSPGIWINPDSYPNSKFIFGPQFWLLPDPNHPFFTQSNPEHASRCIFTCLSNWIIGVFKEFIDTSKSNIPFLPLPFGLDIQPIKKEIIEYDSVVYYKARHPSLLNFIELALNSLTLKYKVYKYGSYDRSEYIQTLGKSRFAIWLGSHESQGFGFQECLATGTPIFVYDVKSLKDECSTNGQFNYTEYSQILTATTASYWDSRCGMKVYSNEEFIEKLPEFISKLDSFRPSEYVKETLSDEVCFKKFLDALNLTLPISSPNQPY